MRRCLLAIGVITALLIAACAPRPVLPRHPGGATIRIKVKEGTLESVRDLPLEDYVAGAALSEAAPGAAGARAAEAMFEVQAIVARTYAEAHRGRHAREGFDLCSTTHCQIYEPARLAGSRWAPVVLDAVQRTAGVILMYDGAPADAVYHADCGGWTSAAEDVWSGPPRAYLPARPDRGDAKDAHVAWQYSVGRDALQRALNSDSRSRLNGTLVAITVLSRDASGRARQVLLRADRANRPNNDVSVRGTDLREVLTNAFGIRSIRSTLFDVVANGREFRFSGSGFGHGVGLCQVGALARVTAGETPRAVLMHYYPGTSLTPSSRTRQD